MEEYCAGLLETMEKQLAVYEKLLSLATEKQPVLIKGNISELDRITKEEELLILQVGRLEEQRNVLHQRLANHFGLSPEELSLSELAKRTGEDIGENFQKLLQKMAEVLGNLADFNKNNTELIKSSLDFINYSLNILTSSDTKPGYAESDDGRKDVSAKIFDRKI